MKAPANAVGKLQVDPVKVQVLSPEQVEKFRAVLDKRQPS